MKIAGIIAEYNPFHNGHAYHLGMTRERADAVVAVMSGNFVQRAEPAILNKFARARAAVECGADLVIELPTSWAMSTAQRFARGAVGILDSLGCVDFLSFGSESADLTLILKAAEAVDSKEVSGYIRQNLTAGKTFASVREDAVKEFFGADTASVLSAPNDILGVEYCRALLNLGSSVTPCPVKRINADHNSEECRDGFASASLIRSMIRKGESVSLLLPPESMAVLDKELKERTAPSSIEYLERAVLLKLRLMTPSELAGFPDISEGIENRIIDAAKRCSTLQELYDAVKTKRYTHSRVRRIVMSVLLDVNYRLDYVPYARVLAFNSVGAEVLRKAKKTTRIPIITKKSELDFCNDIVKNAFESECRASEIFSMLTGCVPDFGTEFTNKIYIKKL
ncbi:MAG: nucleotidyltransferase [Clostridia bacterium]|nr:nucleotidyltransferase [Clostridia bacterium]